MTLRFDAEERAQILESQLITLLSDEDRATALARAENDEAFADALAGVCDLAARQNDRFTRRQCTIFLEQVAGKSYTDAEGSCSPIYMAEKRELVDVFVDPPDSEEKWVTAESFAGYLTAFDPRVRKERD